MYFYPYPTSISRFIQEKRNADVCTIDNSGNWLVDYTKSLKGREDMPMGKKLLLGFVAVFFVAVVPKAFCQDPPNEKIRDLAKITAAGAQEEITRLKKKADDLVQELFETNAELVGSRMLVEELAKELKKAYLGNMALSKLITELIQKKEAPSLQGSIDMKKKELYCGDWILFNPKKICEDVCEESGFVRTEKIDKNLMPGIHINTNEYFAWIYEPEAQVFHRQELKRVIPEQSIVLLDWER